MDMNLGGDSSYTSEINITPLVDVVLVLLIIFMVIVPVMMRGYDVDIPGETVVVAPREDRPEQMVLLIDPEACPLMEPPEAHGPPAGCTVMLNEELLPATDLAGRVSEVFGSRAPADRVLFLAADEKLNYEGVMQILDTARSGVEGLRIGLVTDGG